jgi:hypothetical protein
MEHAAAIFGAILVTTATGLAAEIHVSLDGDDANPGTVERPLRSLAAAQRTVRTTKAGSTEPISVIFHEGAYYLPETVVFTTADSGSAEAPITYAAAPGEDVTISGGVLLDLTWTRHEMGIMKADVPAGFATDQLFVNGRRQHMARYPNFNPDARYYNGFAADAISHERAKQWSDPRGGFIHALHRSRWGSLHYEITGRDESGALQYVGGWQNNRRAGMHEECRFVENIRDELDAPGEWFFEAEESTLYFIPPDGLDLDHAVIEAVRLTHLIELRGSEDAPVRHLTFQGLTFTHAARTFMDNREPLLRSDWTTYRGGAIVFDGAEDCAIRDCSIDQVGGNAVFISNFNRRIEITSCRIVDAGASGVSFVGDPDAVRSPLFEHNETQTLEEMDHTPGPKTSNYPSQCRVHDNLITRIGRTEKQSAGVNISMASEITISHNSIYDVPRAGINICDGTWGGHVIEFNDVFDTVKETGDHGSFNSWGRDRFWHKDRALTAEWVARNPDMPKWDAVKPTIIRNNRWRCDHGWDIDLDDGSSNYRIYSNLCLKGGIKLREGYFRTVENNVIVGNTFHPHAWYPDCHTAFRRNIIWQDEYRPARMKPDLWGDELDSNLVHDGEGKTGPAKGLREMGGADRHSRSDDAMLVDPAGGDYRVTNGSPALELGFESFPMDEFGVLSPGLRAEARTPMLP